MLRPGNQHFCPIWGSTRISLIIIIATIIHNESFLNFFWKCFDFSLALPRVYSSVILDTVCSSSFSRKLMYNRPLLELFNRWVSTYRKVVADLSHLSAEEEEIISYYNLISDCDSMIEKLLEYTCGQEAWVLSLEPVGQDRPPHTVQSPAASCRATSANHLSAE